MRSWIKKKKNYSEHFRDKWGNLNVECTLDEYCIVVKFLEYVL